MPEYPAVQHTTPRNQGGLNVVSIQACKVCSVFRAGLLARLRWAKWQHDLELLLDALFIELCVI